MKICPVPHKESSQQGFCVTESNVGFNRKILKTALINMITELKERCLKKQRKVRGNIIQNGEYQKKV